MMTKITTGKIIACTLTAHQAEVSSNRIDPIHKWRLFYFCCYCANQPTKPQLRARIIFNLAHDNEA